jgi:hypothetical protein
MSTPNNNNGFGTMYTQPLRIRNTQNSAENYFELASTNGASIYRSISYQILADSLAGTYNIYDNTYSASSGTAYHQGILITGPMVLLNCPFVNTYTLRIYFNDGTNGTWTASCSTTPADALVGSNIVFLQGGETAAVPTKFVQKIEVTVSSNQANNATSTIVIPCQEYANQGIGLNA